MNFVVRVRDEVFHNEKMLELTVFSEATIVRSPSSIIYQASSPRQESGLRLLPARRCAEQCIVTSPAVKRCSVAADPHEQRGDSPKHAGNDDEQQQRQPANEIGDELIHVPLKGRFRAGCSFGRAAGSACLMEVSISFAGYSSATFVLAGSL